LFARETTPASSLTLILALAATVSIITISFVLAKGNLTVLDLVMLQAAWGKTTVQRMIKAGASGHTLTRQQRRSGQQQPVSEIDLLIDLLSILPHSVQARIDGARRIRSILSRISSLR
jgi:hypothetical protein